MTGAESPVSFYGESGTTKSHALMQKLPASKPKSHRAGRKKENSTSRWHFLARGEMPGREGGRPGSWRNVVSPGWPEKDLSFPRFQPETR